MKLDERRSEEQKQRETDRVLVLRTCAADLTSKNGFVWPSSGHVLCPDWAPTAECGHGLHGLLWGAGDGSLLDWSLDAKWLVVAVEPSQLVALDGKVKFAAGEVVHCGDQASATAFLSRDPRAICVVGGTSTSGARGTSTSGDDGELRIRWRDSRANRYRTVIAYVGENGIKPNVPYRLNDVHEFVEVTP